MLIVRGSFVAGSDNPHDGIDAAGGPSTPSVGLGFSSDWRLDAWNSMTTALSNGMW